VIWEGGECSHTTEEAIGVSQSAMSVGPGSIYDIRYALFSSPFNIPLLALTVSDSPRTIVGDLTREMATTSGAKSPLPAHGKVMPWALWTLYHKTIVESSSKRYCGWKAHAWSGRWGLLPSIVGIRAVITIEMNEKGIRWLPARVGGMECQMRH